LSRDPINDACVPFRKIELHHSRQFPFGRFQ
jgi:hypothetical protein